MVKLVFAPEAELDLRAIVEYIAEDKPQAARRWLAKVKEKCRLGREES